MTDSLPTIRFDGARHRVAGFSCGRPSLDRWLAVYAGQGERRDAARTFVSAAPGGRVRGYYTLVAAQIERSAATRAVGRGMSRHFPIPVALIARLAVDERDQGRGLGHSLVVEAMRRIVSVADEIAVRAVVVEAIDERAAAFYRPLGFEPSGIDESLLMLAMPTVRRVLDPEPR